MTTPKGTARERAPTTTRGVRYWWNRYRAWLHEWPSWRVVYPDGVSYALRYDDARTRCELFDGIRVEYCRDENGDLVRDSFSLAGQEHSE